MYGDADGALMMTGPGDGHELGSGSGHGPYSGEVER